MSPSKKIFCSFYILQPLVETYYKLFIVRHKSYDGCHRILFRIFGSKNSELGRTASLKCFVVSTSFVRSLVPQCMITISCSLLGHWFNTVCNSSGCSTRMQTNLDVLVFTLSTNINPVQKGVSNDDKIFPFFIVNFIVLVFILIHCERTSLNQL